MFVSAPSLACIDSPVPAWRGKITRPPARTWHSAPRGPTPRTHTSPAPPLPRRPPKVCTRGTSPPPPPGPSEGMHTWHQPHPSPSSLRGHAHVAPAQPIPMFPPRVGAPWIPRTPAIVGGPRHLHVDAGHSLTRDVPRGRGHAPVRQPQLEREVVWDSRDAPQLDHLRTADMRRTV